MDRETWWATVHGVAKSQTRLSYGRFHCPFLEALQLCPSLRVVGVSPQLDCECGTHLAWNFCLVPDPQ